MSFRPCWQVPLIVLPFLFAAPFVSARPSPNVINDGDFEDFTRQTYSGAPGETVEDWSFVKRRHSPRTEAEIAASADPIWAWKFHPQFDLGRWIPAKFGAGDQNVYPPHGGITNYDAPRPFYQQETLSWAQEVNPFNISLDPYRPDNHALENVYEFSWFGQFVQAPQNQAPGHAQLDFDYFLKHWVPPNQPDTRLYLMAFVFGVPTEGLPTWQQAWGPKMHSPGTVPTGPNAPQGWQLLFQSPLWSNASEGRPSGFVNITAPGYDDEIWRTYSDGVEAVVNPTTGQTIYSDGSFSIPAIFPYYYVEFLLASYDPGYYYWWFYAGKPSDEFSAAVDNVALQFAITDIPGDFNQDGLVNVLDISPFVTALLNTEDYLAQHPWANPLSLDPNGDGLFNALDIQPFVNLLIGAPVPEPQMLLTLALAWLLARSRRH